MSNEYDSTADTLRHIKVVNTNLIDFATALLNRARKHDDSKLGPVEKPHFDRESPKLAELKYGTPEYMASLGRLQEALVHHYAANRHHPEHYDNGVNDMSLIDVVEMFCDWVAASKRTKGGKLNLTASFERFDFDPQLASIFRKTADAFGIDYE